MGREPPGPGTPVEIPQRPDVLEARGACRLADGDGRAEARSPRQHQDEECQRRLGEDPGHRGALEIPEEGALLAVAVMELVHEDHAAPHVGLRDVQGEAGMTRGLEHGVAEDRRVGQGDDGARAEPPERQDVAGAVGEERRPALGTLTLEPHAAHRLDRPDSRCVGRGEGRPERSRAFPGGGARLESESQDRRPGKHARHRATDRVVREEEDTALADPLLHGGELRLVEGDLWPEHEQHRGLRRKIRQRALPPAHGQTQLLEPVVETLGAAPVRVVRGRIGTDFPRVARVPDQSRHRRHHDDQEREHDPLPPGALHDGRPARR
ncbi:MAG: hypothetical protein A2050_11725 [Candidatus Rokubacteria bacterium GWA2_73_35]|nr:MAG: hypothetical protein A2050_11725 [Candidatus Rokubacteria bacterium GWA2_73_35]